MCKAMSNICAATVPAINEMLLYLFGARGRCYVQDTGGMEMRYVFEFALTDVERAIILQSGVMPRPSGVLMRLHEIDVPRTFGFAQAALEPFGSGVFFQSINT
jgi:hypothetical protein